MFLPFTKMHGLGNDYIVIDERDEVMIPEDQKADVAQALSKRGFSIGSDGVLYLGDTPDADVEMRIFNADGSEAESCGNGLRCTAFFQHGIRRVGSGECTIDLPLAGIIDAYVEYDKPPTADVRLTLDNPGTYVEQRTVEADGRSLEYHYVDVGNPHAVFFLDENTELPDDLDDLLLDRVGTALQNHADFKDTGGINAEFVTLADNGVDMLVHERGVGPTASCGTGCVGIARACAETDRASGWVDVHQPGGTLSIETDDGHMQGPAELSHTGITRVNLDQL